MFETDYPMDANIQVCAMVGDAHCKADPPERFADEIWSLRDREALHVLGGCCGTTDAHMHALASRMAGALDAPPRDG